jgi:hypothetical protein
MPNDSATIHEYYFQRGQQTRRALIRSWNVAGRALSRTVLIQQAIGTIWFWGANISDQLHASGHGENAATWLGGGCGFLLLSALLQLQVLRSYPTRRNAILLSIQSVSAVGNLVALSIFAYRRFAWTVPDTLCVLVVDVTMVAALVWHMWRHADPRRLQAISAFVSAGWVMVLVAVELRSIPRLFQGVSLFWNNPMSVGTVLSGCYIAAIRLCAIRIAHRHTPSPVTRRAWQAELWGNAGSQAALTVGWVAAVVFR